MESASQVSVPLRSGGKKMRKRRELDALVAHSLAKRANKKNCAGNGIHSQDQLLSPSTDEQDDITWPKVVRSSNRTRNRKFSFLQTCIPIVFVISVALSLGFVYWLHFDLKQQLYDYRNRIEEVELSNQNVPDALQKWHKTSKTLEQNQTILAGKLVEIHSYVEDLRGRFSVLEAKMNEKKDYEKDEKFVADFGAEIKAVSVDVDRLKEQFAGLQKSQNDIQTEMNTLKSNFTEAVINATRRANNNETSFSDELKQAQTTIFNEIKQLTSNVSLINDTLSQKTKILSDDQRSQQRQLEVVQDRVDNTSARVDSVERDWHQNKNIQADFVGFINSSSNELHSLKNITIDLQNRIESVRLDCNKVRNDVLQSFSSTEKKEATTAKKDMSRENEKILTILGADNTTKSTTPSNVPPPDLSGIFQTTSGTAVTSPPKPTSVRTESSTAAVTAAEGKPKLLSIQTISKPV